MFTVYPLSRSTGVQRYGCIPRSAANNLGEVPKNFGSSKSLVLKSFWVEATSPEVLLLWNLTVIHGFPGSSPDFPGSSPDFPGSFPDFPRGQPLSLGSLTPSPDSQKLSLTLELFFFLVCTCLDVRVLTTSE